MKNKISVIVPVYNAEQYVEDCLHSLLTQTYTNIEILAVNDGSTDQSKNIVEEYAKKDKRIRVFSTPNRGVSAARNLALEHATGEWITFCDSDDVVPRGAYAKMVRAAIRTDSDVIVGGLKIQKPKETIYFKYKNRQGAFWLFYYGPSLCNRLFRRETIQGLCFDPLTVGEDVVYLTKVFHKTRNITAVRHLVYIYINREDEPQKSLTHSYSLETFKSHISAWSTVRSLWSREVQERGDFYLARVTVPYFYQQLLLVPAIEAKCDALAFMKAFLKQIPWNKYEISFEATFGMTYDCFCSRTEMEFFDQVLSRDSREIVLAQFRAGSIGFRYIIKYFKQWFNFKLYGERAQ